MNDLIQNFIRAASPEFKPIIIRLTEIIESSIVTIIFLCWVIIVEKD